MQFGATRVTGAIVPHLTVVRQFGDDFHLVGIGVSKTGRVFATAPQARARNSLSMIEVNTKTGQATPFPDAAWNTIRPEADGKPEWSLVQVLWDDSADHLWALDTGIARGKTPIQPKLVEFDLTTNQPIRTYGFEGTVTIADALPTINEHLDADPSVCPKFRYSGRARSFRKPFPCSAEKGRFLAPA